MIFRQKLSDDEFVHRIDRFQSRTRRPFGISMVIFSALFGGLTLYYVSLIESGVLRLFSDADSQVPFLIGTLIGFFGGLTVFTATFYLFTGLEFLFSRRKDLLLIEYHSRLVEMGELEGGVQQ